MAGFPRAFGPDVTDRIMRFAVGYPRDRLKDMTATVKRRERYYPIPRDSSDSGDLRVSWRLPTRTIRLGFFTTGAEPYRACVCFEHARLEWDWESIVDDLAFTCDACEPAELQLQRTHF